MLISYIIYRRDSWSDPSLVRFSSATASLRRSCHLIREGYVTYVSRSHHLQLYYILHLIIYNIIFCFSPVVAPTCIFCSAGAAAFEFFHTIYLFIL